tara:strand:- start:25 stop:201 length:177 start_codon:yes stop_codon:yes gene_type:complete
MMQFQFVAKHTSSHVRKWKAYSKDKFRRWEVGKGRGKEKNVNFVYLAFALNTPLWSSG